MEVLESAGEIVFLKKLREGAAAESYGLHVARLAGLPIVCWIAPSTYSNGSRQAATPFRLNSAF
jgi:hypothetical protein